MPNLTLRKQERLRRYGEFKKIYIGGRKLSGPHLTIFFKPNQLPYNRLGISVAKRRFKLSTCRHRIRRCLREAYRQNKQQFLSGYDLIISAQRSLRAEVAEELLGLAQKARLLNSQSGNQD